MTNTSNAKISLLLCALVWGAAGGCSSSHRATTPESASTVRRTTDTPAQSPSDAPARLGNFSVSLAVKDIGASRAFYEKLGFKVRGGNQAQNWLVLQNETATVGLFQGMFEKNMLTFNPGWDREKKTLADFDDVRAIQRQLLARGLTPKTAADETTTGPAFLMLVDPDGNPILVDQHVPAPKK